MKTKKKQQFSIMKNKKGVFNVGGALSGAGSVLQSIFDLMPKPIKFLFFLILILLIGGLIQSSVQIFGIYCDSNDNPVNIGLNIVSNIDLLNEVPSVELIGKEVMETGDTTLSSISAEITKCSRHLQRGTILKDDGTEEEFTSPRWFYDGTHCTSCESVKVYELANTNDRVISEHVFCEADSFRIENEDKSFWKRITCGGVLGCEPPEHYYYDSAINLYVCADDTCTGITAGQIWNEKLMAEDGKYLYPEGDKGGKSYTNFVGIGCKDIRPKITVFGIPIFDYQMWILGMLVFMLVWFYTRIKTDKK